MIRFYKNKTPQKGEIVVVSIKTHKNSIITCNLLEYSGIEGVICRADVSRNSARVYNSLEVGQIIPVICSDVDMKPTGEIYIDLNYVTMDKEQISHYKDRYEKILRIIQIFTWICGTSLPQFENVEYNDYINHPEIKAITSSILSDSLYKMTKDEIQELFFEDVYKLHKIASMWKVCSEIPGFSEKLMERFPKPKISIILQLNLQSSKCYGTNEIKILSKKVNDAYQSFDPNINLEFTVITVPTFRVAIKSDNIDNMNYQQYYDIINEIVESFSHLNSSVKIVSHNIETSTGTKLPLKIISVDTEIVEATLD